MSKKEYKATSKIRYAFAKEQAMRDLAECYVENDKHDRAEKAFLDTDVLNTKAWSYVYELYPILKNKKISYRKALRVIQVNK